MVDRRRLYVAGFVGASIADISTTLAFTGQFDVRQWAVFAVVFLLVFAGFERVIAWADTLGVEMTEAWARPRPGGPSPEGLPT